MKKTIAVIMLTVLTGCGAAAPKAVNTYEPEMGNNVIVEYTEMNDSTWQSGGRTYDYRIELTGKAQDSDTESTFVVLTNNNSLTFDQLAESMQRSDSASPDDAVVVEMK